ncbi:macro domain-containing protein [Streptomyces iakyrus]|uniref:macro domain-containing protein n=1 Tax=Streptomyces iakyrus TaxID=68219 RepID=UPI0038204746
MGDLFSEDTDLVIGFTDTYDTSTDNANIISPNSIQGQFLQKIYDGDTHALDVALQEALNGFPHASIESRLTKAHGKLIRYPIGTVAVLSKESSQYYCVAYSEMSNTLAARSSVNNLWKSLESVWSAIAGHGHSDPVSLPIIGSELARVDNLGRESLLKMIILSFVARSRESVISRGLTVVIHPKDADQIDMNEVQAFLRSV